MQRSILGLALLAGLSALGCSTRSGEMRLAEPHDGDAKALVDFRVEYATKPPKEVSNTVLYDDADMGSGQHAVFAQTARVKIATELWHLEPRTTRELVEHSRNEYEYEYKTHSCASRDSHGQCQSGTVLESVLKTKYYSEWEDVTRQVKIPEGSCATTDIYRFADQHRYVVTFLYRGPSACEIRCVDAGGGSCETAAASAVAPAVREEKVESPLRRPGFGLAVVGSAGLVTFLGFLVARNAQYATASDHCDGLPACDAEGSKAEHEGHVLAKLSTIPLVAGGAAVVAGVVMFETPAKWVRVQVGAVGAREVGLVGTF